MVKRGEVVVCTDPDIRDQYIGVTLNDEAYEGSRTLRVRVLDILQYPIQHAVMHPDIASENPPLLPNAVARLRFLGRVQGLHEMDGRFAPAAEYYLRYGPVGYWAALDRCLADYARRVEERLEYDRKHPTARALTPTDPDELLILARHKERIFEGTRSCLDDGRLYTRGDPVTGR